MQAIAFDINGDNVLTISGALTRDTIPSVYQQWRREITSSTVTSVDVSALDTVDTAGVALLLELIKTQKLTLLPCTGASQQLQQIAAVSGVEGLLSLS